MANQYLFNVEVSMDDFDLWTFPEELGGDEAASLPTTFKFAIRPSLCLEITDEEFIDQVNCGTKCTKSAIISYDQNALDGEISGEITVFKFDDQKLPVIVGCYSIENLNKMFKQLVNSFIKKVNGPKKNGLCSEDTPTCDVRKELAQLMNDDCPCGAIFYTLRVTCCGLSVKREKLAIPQEVECDPDSQKLVNDCDGESSEKTLKNSCSKKSFKKPEQPMKTDNYDEYSAQINGNELIVRVRKEDSSSMLVTRVYENVDEKLSRDVSKFTLKGCGQKIDFQLPTCPETSPQECDEKITNHQIQTSLLGKFKNSCKIPVIRGNLKYPGKITDQSVRFDVFNDSLKKIESSTDKFRLRDAANRNVGMQINEHRIKEEVNGVKNSMKLKDGIEVCNKGSVDDCDVFIFKLGRKRIDKNGESSQIELEMRTPKGPDNGVKRMETRESQVFENEFDVVGDRKKKSDETKSSNNGEKCDPKKKVGMMNNASKKPTKAKTVDTKKSLMNTKLR